MQAPISLETPISDLIEDRAVVSPAEAIINVDLKEQTARVLHMLGAREAKVVSHPFPGLFLRARLARGVYSRTSSRNNLSLPEREGWRSRSFLKPHRSGKSGTSQIVSFEHAKASAALAASCKRASRKCARGRDQ